MAVLQEDFWCDVGQTSGYGMQLLFTRMEMLRTRITKGKLKDKRATPAVDLHSEISDNNITVSLLLPVEYVLGFEVSVHDVVLVEIMNTFEDGANNGDGVLLGEFALLQNALKEFAAGRQLEREIVFRPRFEPFVEFDLRSMNVKVVQVKLMRSLTMLGWSKPFRTSISPQTLASFPLTFFLGMIFKATSFTMPDSSLCFAGRGDDGLEPFEDILELVGVVGKGSSVGPGELGEPGELSMAAAAPRSATATWSTGTCHVARLIRQVDQQQR